MYGANIAEVIVVLFVCLLPAAAVLLSIFASVLAFMRVARKVSLVLAILCLVIYVVVGVLFVGTHLPSQLGQDLDSLPAGTFFHSLIPLVAVIVVIGFNIKRKRK